MQSHSILCNQKEETEIPLTIIMLQMSHDINNTNPQSDKKYNLPIQRKTNSREKSKANR